MSKALYAGIDSLARLEATTDSFFAGAKTGSYMLCAPQNEPNFQVFEQ